MSVQVGSVAVGIQVDVRNAVNNLRRAEKQLDQLAAGAQGSVKTINKFNKSLNALGVAAGAASFAVIKLGRSSFRAAADVSEMSVAMEAVNKSLKLPPGRINKTANEIRSMGIEMKAQEMSLLFAQGNLDMAKAADVARVAQDLAVLSQSNSTQTAKTLAYAIQTGNSRLLKSAGITKYAGEAYAEYAATLGKTEAQLTATERQTAVMNMILEEGAKVAGTYEAAMTEPGKVLRSFPRLLNDMQIEFGNVLKEGFGPAIKAGYDLTKAFSKTMQEGGALHPVLVDLGEAFGDMMDPLTDFLKDTTETVKNLNYVGISVEDVQEKFEKFTPTISAVTAGLSLFAGKQILGSIPVVGRFANLLGGPLTTSMAVFALTNEDAREAVRNVVDALRPLAEAMAKVAQVTMEFVAIPALNFFARMAKAITSVAGGAEALGTAILLLIARKKLLATGVGKSLVASFAKAKAAMMENIAYQRALAAQAGTTLTRFQTFGAGVTATMRGASAAVKGFMVSMGPMLAITAGISLVVAAYTRMTEAARKAKEEAARLEEVHIRLARAIRDTTDAALENADAFLADGGAGKALADTLLNTLDNTEEVLAAFGELGQMANFDTIVEAATDFQGFSASILEAAGAPPELAKQLAELERQMQGSSAKSQVLTQHLFENADAFNLSDEALMNLAFALGTDGANAFDILGSAMQAVDFVRLAHDETNAAFAAGDVTQAMIDQANAFANQQKQLMDLNSEQRAAIYLQELLRLAALDAADAQEVLASSSAEAKTALSDLGKIVEEYSGLAGDAALSTQVLAEQMGIAEESAENKLRLAILRLGRESQGLYKNMAQVTEGTMSLEQVVRSQSDAMLDAVTDLTTLGGGMDEILPVIYDMTQSLYDSAEAAGVDREAVAKLIDEIGILDGLSAEAKIAITGDVSGMTALVEALRLEMQRLALADGPAFYASKRFQSLSDEITGYQRIIDAATDSTSAFTAGGGFSRPDLTDPKKNGASEIERAAEELQKAIDNFSKTVASFGQGLVGEDFAERLLGMHPDDMAEAFNEIALKALDFYDIAQELELPGGDEFMRQIGALGDKFDELAEAQREVIRLQQEFSREVDVYRELNGELDRITEQYRQFRDEVDGSNTPLERVADALKAFKEARSDLDRLNSSYDKFMYQEGLRESTLGERIDEEIKTYRRLQGELDATQREQENFRQGIVDMMAPSVAGAAGRGGVLGNLNNILTQAKTFRDNLAELRTRGFPTDVIQQVIGAGLGTGSKIARRLLAMSTGDYAEFLALREQISALGAETAQIAGEVLFGSDTADAEGRLQEQLGVVQSLYQQAIQQAQAAFDNQQRAVEVQKQAAEAAYQNAMADAQAKLDAQRLVVEGLEESLAGASSYMESLVSAIQLDLRDAFDTFLGGLGGEITRLLDSMAARLERFQSIAQAAESAASRAMSAAAAANAQARAAQNAASSGGADPLAGKFTARARGGPLRAGQLSLVGEKGPELFVPGQSGTVIPHHRIGGNTTVNYNINVRAVGDPAEAGRQIVKQIQEYERRNGSRWRS